MATNTTREGTAPPFINNASSYGHSTQTIIGSINHYTRIPDDLPLPAHDNTEVLQNCRRLHLLISQASLTYRSSTATKSYCHRIRTLLSSIYEAIAKPRVSAPNAQPGKTHLDSAADIITKVLLVCSKAIYNFESKAKQGTIFCMITDLNELRNSLRNCLFYLFTSLLNIHETDPLSRSSIAGIDEVIGDILRCHWRCQTIIIKLTGSGYAELEDHIKLYDASIATTFLPIPMVLCGSPHQMHVFLLTAYGHRPWHEKIEHNEYILESNDLTKEVQPHNWGEMIRPGEIVYMTMLIKRKGVMSDTSCRECRAMNVEKICGDRKMRCLSCGLVSSVTESTPETGIVDPASKKEIDSQAKPSKTSGNPMKERFLRIRYDCDISTRELSSTQKLLLIEALRFPSWGL